MSRHLLRGALALIAGLTLASCGNNTTDGSAVADLANRTSTTTTTTTPTHTPYIPKPEDFALTVKVLEQKCFGSAGCNVTFRLEVAYSGSYLQAGEGPYTVVYNLAGTDDPFVGRFELQPPDQYTVTEEYVQTPPGGTLTATVSQVF